MAAADDYSQTYYNSRFWYGLACVFAQCFLSLSGIVLMPLRNKSAYKYVIQTMAAFAVGALLGNAIIHLIPQAIVGSTGGDGHHSASTAVAAPVRFSNSSYARFPPPPPILIHTWHEDEPPPTGHRLNNQQRRKRQAASINNFNNSSSARSIITTSPTPASISSSALIPIVDSDHNQHEQRTDPLAMYRMLVTLGAILAFFAYHSLTTTGTHAHSSSSAITTSTSAALSPFNTASVVAEASAPATSANNNTKNRHHWWHVALSRRATMVILGDAIHNFADGLATAAAFAAGTDQGITTTIAIVFHETAHEVGDFAILLHSGMSFSTALGFNFLGSMSAIVGYLVGAVIVGGEHHEAIVLWILSLTAGIFIYIALVDMLPELMEQQQHQPNRRLILFTMQFLAITSGIVVVAAAEYFLISGH